MFSIIIPLYNKAQYIEKTINSILNQTYQNFELIIINDGSTDDSLVKVNQYKDRRLKVFTQENVGVSITRNNGVKVAKNEFIAFLDADDWWSNFFLEEMYNLITNSHEAGLYGSNYFIVKNGLNKPAHIGINPNFLAGYIDYFKVYANTFWVPLNCSFVVVKKSVFEEMGGFKPELKFGEDFDLWVRIALKHKIAYLNKFLAFSNQDVETANRALGGEKCWKKEEHLIFNLDYLKNQEKNNPDLKLLLDGLRVRLITNFYLRKKYINEVKNILNEIDFSQQPFLFRFIYHWPKLIVLIYFQAQKCGSYIKRKLLTIKNKRTRF